MKGSFGETAHSNGLYSRLACQQCPLSWVQAVAYKQEPVKIPQFLMTATASSEESKSDTCYASYAIDGDTGTMWHTR